MNTTKQKQMELGFGEIIQQQPQSKRSQRQTRAQWWFAQMRRVVDQALEWNAPPARLRQVDFNLSGRQRIF